MKERMLRSFLPAWKVVVAAALLALLPQAAQAQSSSVPGAQSAAPSSALQREIARRVPADIRAFYAARANRPLWLDAFGRPSGAASLLLHHLRTAQFDGADPQRLGLRKVARLVDKARRGDTEDVAKAEVALSAAFAAYVRAMRGASRDTMIYESQALAPVIPTPVAALQGAAAAPSLDDYVAEMRWMHPLYAPLRAAMVDPRFSESQRRQIWTNLGRIRAIPALTRGKHILVDAASARLWMYEDGRAVDSMRVVVGRPELPTPMIAGFVRTAILNPYWNVPDDLVRTNIAANVIDQGTGYLRGGGYQVLDGWRDNPALVDPATVDWQSVHQGRHKVRIRQLPGGVNFMGRVKFEFPNAQGIYLHDTPDKHLLQEDMRQLSSGCVRLEDAARLHRWLMGEPLPARVREAEKVVPLPELVPVYITYLTAMPEGQAIAFHGDPYGRDGFQLAAVGDRPRTDRP